MSAVIWINQPGISTRVVMKPSLDAPKHFR